MLRKADKNLILNIGIILISLFLFIAFPIDPKSMFQRLVVNVTFLLVIPALYIKIVLKKELSDFGVTKGKMKVGIFWGLLSLITAALIFYLVIQYTGFSQNYLIPDLVRLKFSYFLLYQLLLVGFFTISYEFFFRGFVMLGMEKYLGRWAMLAQFILFLIFLMFTGGIEWQMFYFILMAALSALVVEKSRSIIYSIAAVWIFILLADAWVIRFIK